MKNTGYTLMELMIVLDQAQRPYMAENRRGFTLIDPMIAVVIIGLLAAIALPKFANSKEKAYDATALADLRHLVEASEAYFADHLQYPEALADLTDWVPSNGVVVTDFDRQIVDGVIVLHVHIGHQSSSHYFCLQQVDREKHPLAGVRQLALDPRRPQRRPEAPLAPAVLNPPG